MFPQQITQSGSDEFIRCRDSSQSMSKAGDDSRKDTKADSALVDEIYHALWKDDVLRAIEYDQFDVHVKNGVIHLTGHIVNTSSQNRIMKAIRTVPGILVIHNHLVLDEKLTLEVATSLGRLEHMYDCKFFTGASHGILSLNGVVSSDEVEKLAEKCAAGIPNVRGVISHVRVSGSERAMQDRPFLQPVIGETIYFMDGLSGIVKQVIINPNNLRVTAMAIQGSFNEQRNELQSPADGTTTLPEQRIVVPMDVVRYLTKGSGFLSINSTESNQYQDFDLASFFDPILDWVPPYPYCPEDVLFPIEFQTEETRTVNGYQPYPAQDMPEGASFKEQLFANDSMGG